MRLLASMQPKAPRAGSILWATNRYPRRRAEPRQVLAARLASAMHPHWPAAWLI